jgi:hypothetical protein
MSSHTCRRPNSEGASLSLAAYSSDTCTANTGLKDEWDAGLLGAQQLIKRGFTVSASATLGAVGSIVCKLHASGEYTGAPTGRRGRRGPAQRPRRPRPGAGGVTWGFGPAQFEPERLELTTLHRLHPHCR